MGRLETYPLVIVQLEDEISLPATGSTGDLCIPTAIGVTTVHLLIYDAFSYIVYIFYGLFFMSNANYVLRKTINMVVWTKMVWEDLGIAGSNELENR